MRRTWSLCFVIALAAFLLPGCETLSTSGKDGGDQASLEQFGGFTTENEAPGFGDPSLVSGYPDDPPFDDDMANHPTVTGGLANGGAKIYLLRIVWGNLDNPDTNVTAPGACPVTDWSGSIAIDGGVVVIERLIRFERGDRITRPRRGPRGIEWTSYTGPDFDGLLLKIIDVPDRNSRPAANTVTITTPLYSAVIPLADLQDYREFVVFNDCNRVSVIANGISRVRCPRGFAEGLWTAATDTSGTFKGSWIRDDGSLAGHVRGRYGIQDSTRVLFGKRITLSGAFGGLLKGTWMPSEQDEAGEGPAGTFDGNWYNESLTVTGVFKGHYRLRGDEGHGYFHARWGRDCK